MKGKIIKLNKMTLGQLNIRREKQYKDYKQGNSLHYKHLKSRLRNTTFFKLKEVK